MPNEGERHVQLPQRLQQSAVEAPRQVCGARGGCLGRHFNRTRAFLFTERTPTSPLSAAQAKMLFHLDMRVHEFKPSILASYVDGVVGD